ncbi:MAG: histidine kinase [Myxococcales bacterium]|nr:histidine kinase [Myxococcales bacterium]
MRIELDASGSVEGLGQLIQTVAADPRTQGLLILAGDDNQFTPEQVDPLLLQTTLPLFGGVFPGIIYGRNKLMRGTIVAGLPKPPKVHVIAGLSDMDTNYDDLIDERIREIDKTRTMFVFVDGLARRISALIDGLFNVFGLEFNYLGGGAGSLSLKQKPCLFTNRGLLADCAVLALSELESGIGVAHGWRAIGGPFSVTESDRNIIRSLDWRPAFDIYKDLVEKSARVKITDVNFFDIAKYHPFGISKIGTERVIRDPLRKLEDGSLVCVGEVPPQALVDVMTGDVNSLVDAAGMALNLSLDSYRGPEAAERTVLFIDCISRVLCMQNEFEQELEAVHLRDTPMIGALTIGEIANSGKDYLEFYNKTAVIGVLES